LLAVLLECPESPLALLIAATAAVHSALLAIGRSPALAHVEPSATAVVTPAARESTTKAVECPYVVNVVYDPAVQLEHPGTFDAVEYCPAAHAMQLLAPVPVPVSVREPAAQAMHEAAVPAPADAYEAAGHAPLHAAVVPMPERA
jgi:hypothetical protein